MSSAYVTRKCAVNGCPNRFEARRDDPNDVLCDPCLDWFVVTEAEIATRKAKEEKPRGVYGEWCRDPSLCAGRGSCPRDPTCAD